jgi:predicted permease
MDIFAGLKSLLQKKRVESDLDEELTNYLEASAADKERRGNSPERARRLATIEMGSRNSVKQQVWQSRWEFAVDNLQQDLRLGIRSLAKSPGFTFIALLSLALGIGANTAIFTLIHQVMLRNMPVQHPEQLVVFGQSVGGGINGGVDIGFNDLVTWDFARQLEANPGPFQGAAAYSSFDPTVSVRDASSSSAQSVSAEPVHASMVSDNYFNVLGANPLLGRAFIASEVDKPGSSPVAVLSYHYWQQQLSADPNILGRSLSVNGAPFRIIGVMPSGFLGIKPDIHPPDLYVPITMESQILLQPPFLEPRSVLFLHMFARRSTASMAAGASGLKQDQLWLDKQIRDYIRAGEGAKLTPEREKEIAHIETMKLLPGAHGVSSLGARYGDVFTVLMVVVILVLLIACANLANFLLARAAARQREIATRLALGSSRLRIVRQCLIETLLLSLAGGLFGLGVAFAATRALIAFLTMGSTFSPLTSTPDLSVMLFTLAVSLCTGFIFGLGPALATARATQAGPKSNFTQSLSANTRATTSGRSARFFPKLLVTAQVVLSLLLLIGAGLFLRSLDNLQSQDFGFERAHLLLADWNPALAGYTPDRLPALQQSVIERIESLPGVRSASLSEMPPISGGTWAAAVTYPTYTPAPKEDMISTLNRVSGHYFETTGIPIVAGRPIAPTDSATSLKVAVVNQTLANRYFPKGDAIGKILHVGIDSIPGDIQIIGIARDTRSGNPHDPKLSPMVYLALTQMNGTDRSASIIEIRTSSNPTDSIADLRLALAQIDPSLPAVQVRTIAEQVNSMISQGRLFTTLTTIFSLLALLLAAIGLYGVMSYSVVRRTNEIGIRLALGAQSNSVLWMVFRESLLLLVIGLAIGLPLTLTTTKLISQQFFGVTAFDPFVILSAVTVITAMTLLAAWLPARRAANVDPMIALRCD